MTTLPTEVSLRVGDCRDILPTLASASVDALITDPPYPEISRSYGRLTEDAWLTLMQTVVIEARRILRPTGSAVFILQPNSRTPGSLRLWLWRFLVWAGETGNIVQDVYWWNPATLPTVHTRRSVGLLRGSVKICVWLGPATCYRNQAAVLWQESDSLAAARHTARARGNDCHTSPSGHMTHRGAILATAAARGGVTPFNLIPLANTDSRTSAGARGHGAGTPLALATWWVRYLCPPDGTVLDPFSGTATMGAAAWAAGCHYIGIESDPGLAALAATRARAYQQQPPLAGMVPHAAD